jgi:hypothetical protein
MINGFTSAASYFHVTCIRASAGAGVASPGRADLTARYRGHVNVSDRQSLLETGEVLPQAPREMSGAPA